MRAWHAVHPCVDTHIVVQALSSQDPAKQPAAQRLLADCDVLFSDDLQPGRRFGSLEVVNPFAPQARDGAEVPRRRKLSRA